MGFRLSGRPHRSIAALAAIAFVITVAWWGLRPPGPTNGEASIPVGEEASTAGMKEHVEDSGAQHKEPTEPVAPVERIVQVPGSHPAPVTDDRPAENTEISGRNVGTTVSDLLASALEGNLDDGFLAHQIKSFCLYWQLNSENTERYIDQTRRMIEESAVDGNPIPPGGKRITWLGFASGLLDGPSARIFATESENRAHHREWTKGCQDVQEIFSEGFRERLEALARAGNVGARYLYAAWDPAKTIGRIAHGNTIVKPLDDLKPGALERNASWHANAIDFSNANLNEGEPAGLVAFGESYVFGKFTGSNHFLGLAALRAALHCDPDLRRVEQLLLQLSVENDLDTLSTDEATNTALLNLADELSTYCL